MVSADVLCRCVQVWCTPRRAVYVVLVVCLAAFLITLPEFFEFRVVEQPSSPGNGTKLVLRPEPTGFGASAGYQLGYNYVNQSLFTFLPVVLLFVFNSLLVKAVLSAARLRHAMTGLSGAQHKVRCQNQRISSCVSHALRRNTPSKLVA